MGDYEQVLTPEDDGFLCPTCSVKRTRSTQRSLRPEHMRMLLTADRGIESQIGPLLRSESTVRICRTCKTQADQALAAAMTTYKTPSFETTQCDRKSPVVLQAALRVKSYPNPVDLFKAILKGKHELDITILGKQPLFLVGSVVEVSRRMQPYVNEEGGIAHVTRVEEDTSDGGLGFLYDVTYVLRNRQEKELPESFLCESSEMLPKKRRVSVDSSALSIEDPNTRRLEKEVAALRAEVDVHKWRANLISRKATEMNRAIKEATCDLQLKDSQMKAERMSTEIKEAQLRVQFAEEMTKKDTEVATHVHQVVLKHQASRREIRRQASEREKILNKELVLKQAELFRHASMIGEWLSESAQQARDGCSAEHQEEMDRQKTEADLKCQAMELEVKGSAERNAALRADLYRAEGHAARHWKDLEQAEIRRTRAEDDARALKDVVKNLEDAVCLLQKKARQRAAYQKTMRKKKHNAIRTQRRQLKTAVLVAKKQVTATTATTCMIKMAKSNKQQSHLTEGGALATIALVNKGAIPDTRAGAAIHSLDTFKEGGGSFNLRSVSPRSMGRLRIRAFMIAIVQGTEEMHILLNSGKFGLQVQLDLTTMQGREIMASMFAVQGSLVKRDEPPDIDGMSCVDSVISKYHNPVLNVEGKSTMQVAWALAQQFKVRGLVPLDCPVAETSKNMHPAFCDLGADQGVENFGGYRTARQHGEGGIFRELFCIKNAEGEVTQRLGMARTCNFHDTHRLDGAISVQFSQKHFGEAASAARYLRSGQVHRVLTPLAKFIAGVDVPCPLKEPGRTMANEKRLPIVESVVKTLRRVAPVPGETRIGSNNGVSSYLLTVNAAVVPAVIISKGQCTTYETCTERINRGGTNMKKTKKFIGIMLSIRFQLNLRVTKIKARILDPLYKGVERSSHCSGTLMHGPHGEISMARRRLTKSIITIRISLEVLKARCMRRIDQSQDEGVVRDMGVICRFLDSIQGPSFVLSIPRASEWREALETPGVPHYRRSQLASHLVACVRHSLNEINVRFSRLMEGRVPPLIMGLSREFAFYWSSKEEADAETVANVRKMHVGTCFEDRLEIAYQGLTIKPIPPLEPRPSDLPSFPTTAEPKVARALLSLWDELSVAEQEAHPPHTIALLAAGPLRDALEAFSEGEITPRTGFPFPLRNWPELHEHIYGFCGPLSKCTSIDMEWAFSIIGIFVRRGNYNAGMYRLGYELLRASGCLDRVDSMTREDVKQARALQRRLESWRDEKTGNERSLLYGAYTNQLEGIEFTALKKATTGPSAVPRILWRLFEEHNGDASKLGVQVLRVLVVWKGGEVKGLVKRSHAQELLKKWEAVQPPEEDLRSEAAKHVNDTNTKKGRTVTRNDNSDDEESSDDEGGCGEEPDENEAALVGRAFMHDEDGKERVVSSVGFDRDLDAIVAYYHVKGKPPLDLADSDHTPAQELMGAEWAKWLDGKPARISDISPAHSSSVEPNSEQLALVDRTFDDIAEGGTFLVFDVSPRTHDGSELVAAYYCHHENEPPADSDRGSWDWYPADELLVAPWAQWHGPHPAESFAGQSLVGATLAPLVDDDASEGPLELPLIEVSDSNGVLPLHETAIAIPYSERRKLVFHVVVTVSLDGGRGESATISRIRDLSEDNALIFESSDKKVLFRAEDFLTNDEGIVMVWGCYLYSYTEVVANGILRSELPSRFDFATELIEGTFPGMLPLVDVVGFATVMTTARRGENDEQGKLHQGGAYVDDDNSKAQWKIVPEKKRSNESITKRRRRS